MFHIGRPIQFRPFVSVLNQNKTRTLQVNASLKAQKAQSHKFAQNGFEQILTYFRDAKNSRLRPMASKKPH